VQFRSVLVLAAHPDDEMGCAGTIAKLADEGATVHLLTFSSCQDLNGPELVTEWERATDLIGANGQMFNLPNRSLSEHRRTILDVLDGRKGYDLILAPASWDEHQDHSTVTQEAIRAYKHSTILGYELPLNTVRESRLSAYVALRQRELDVKFSHAYTYRSQRGKPYMDQRYIEGLARMRGLQSGHEFAEAFETIRWVM
jgi:LmbE family N-acetylglucosaminyl deacetylase